MRVASLYRFPANGRGYKQRTLDSFVLSGQYILPRQPLPHFGKLPGVAKLLGLLVLPLVLGWPAQATAQSRQPGNPENRVDSFQSNTQPPDFSRELEQVMAKIQEQCPQKVAIEKDGFLTVGNGSMVSVELQSNGSAWIRNTQSHLSFLLDKNGRLKELHQLGRPITGLAERNRYQAQIQDTMQWFVTEKVPQYCTSDPLSQVENAFIILKSEVDRLEKVLLVKDPDEAQEITDTAVQVRMQLSERWKLIQEYLATLFQTKISIKGSSPGEESDLEAITLLSTEIRAISQDLAKLQSQSYSSRTNDQELRNAVQRLETISSENIDRMQRVIQQCYVPKPNIKEQIQQFQEARQAAATASSWTNTRYDSDSEDY